MIKNEKQYRISKKRLAEMEKSIAANKTKAIAGSKEEAAVNSLLRITAGLKDEIKKYERLQSKGLPAPENQHRPATCRSYRI